MERLLVINGGKENDVIARLKAKQQELGDSATEEDVAKVMESCIGDGLETLIGDGNEKKEIVLTPEQQAYMKRGSAIVESFMKDNDWHYSTRQIRPDVNIFEMGLLSQGVNLNIRIVVEADPEICRIEAKYQVAADEIYAYPLCKEIARINYSKRFGVFKYDERDGEVVYEYSFPTGHGFDKDNLNAYFRAVVHTASSNFKTLSRYCVGNFNGSEVNEILNKINALVSDINA